MALLRFSVALMIHALACRRLRTVGSFGLTGFPVPSRFALLDWAVREMNRGLGGLEVQDGVRAGTV